MYKQIINNGKIAYCFEDKQMKITKAKADKCVTHHFACDCREYRYERIESALKVIYTWASFELQTGKDMLDPTHVVGLCDRVLGK